MPFLRSRFCRIFKSICWIVPENWWYVKMRGANAIPQWLVGKDPSDVRVCNTCYKKVCSASKKICDDNMITPTGAVKRKKLHWDNNVLSAYGRGSFKKIDYSLIKQRRLLREFSNDPISRAIEVLMAIVDFSTLQTEVWKAFLSGPKRPNLPSSHDKTYRSLIRSEKSHLQKICGGRFALDWKIEIANIGHLIYIFISLHCFRNYVKYLSLYIMYAVKDLVLSLTMFGYLACYCV